MRPTEKNHAKRQMRLSYHLVLLVVSTLLPILVFGAAMVILLNREREGFIQENIIATARALSLALDRELSASIRGLQTLAFTERLDARDLKGFYEQTLRAQKTAGVWDTIALIEPSGQQVTNTRAPFGSALPRTGIPDVVKRVIEERAPVVSDLFTGAVAKKWQVAIGVPVVRDGKVIYILAASIDPAFLVTLLTQQKIPPEWVATVIDRKNVIVAASRDLKQSLGRYATAEFAMKSSRSEEGWFHDSVDRSAYAAFKRSELSGWTVSLAVPSDVIDRPIRRSLLLTLGGGLVLLFAGIAIATGLGGRISKTMAELSAAAVALGDGGRPRPLRSSIAEVSSVADAIAAAASQHRQAEAQLRESEARFRLMADNAPVLIWMSGADAQRSYFNKPWLEFTGRMLEQETGSGWAEGVHREDDDRCLQAYLSAFSDRRSFTREYRLRRGDGEYRWILESGLPRFATDGQFTGYIGSCIDITERKRAEIAAHETQLRYETLARVAPVGIFETDAAGQCLYFNEHGANLIGLPPEDTWGDRWTRALHSEDRERVVAEWRACIRDKRPFQSEYRFRSPSGKVTWVYGQAVPKRNLHGEVTGYVGTVTDVSGIKEADQKLRDSEERFKIVARATNDAVWDLNLLTGEVWWNEAMQSVFGYSALEVGRDLDWWTAQIHPEDKEAIQSSLQAAIKSDASVWSGEYRYRRADASYAYVFDRGYIIRGEEGTAVRMIGAMVDITKRKQAEEALRQSEERLRQLTDNIQEVFWMTDPSKQQMIYISPAYERIWGRSRESVYASAMSWMESIHPDDRRRVADAALKQLYGDYDLEYRITRGDGTVRWIRDRAFPVKDAKGNVYRIAGIAEDITLLKEADEALKQRYRDLQILHRISAAVLTSSDLEGTLRTILESAVAHGGFDFGTVLLVGEADESLRTVASYGYREPANLQRRPHMTPEGRAIYRPLSSLTTRVLESVTDAEGVRTLKREGVRSAILVPVCVQEKVLGVFHLGSRAPRKFFPEEIHLAEALASQMGLAVQKIRLHEQLQTRIAELAEANRIKSEFLGVMSHELRTPLNIIMGYTSVMRDGMFGALETKQEEALRKIEAQSHSLLGMINTIMEAIKIESEALVLESHAFSLTDFLLELKSIYDLPLEKELRLIWDWPRDLPVINADRTKLRHILQNLINNAIKFTDQGSVTVSARALNGARPEDPGAGEAETNKDEAAPNPSVEFSVADTGIGIAAEDQSIIFEMFRQVDGSETRPYGGVGLGLYIVKSFTDLLGGSIELKSELGKGSAFTVRIPCRNG
jgi:PAS domain S-box-containing protein